MKSLILATLFVFSSAVFAKTPASVAVSNLLPAGDYVGKNGNIDCSVTIKPSADYVSIMVANSEQTKFFTIIDSGIYYNVDEATGEVIASQTFRYPHSIGGGSRFFSIKNISENEVEVYIVDTILDHHGNDTSTYAVCTIVK